MKKILSIAILLLALNTVKAQCILRLINNTSKSISCAIAHYDSENRLWICEGWYSIEAYGERKMDFGDYSGKVYIHGVQSAYLGLSEVTWGKGYNLCVDTKNAFTIRGADHVDCDTKRAFSEKRLNTGVNNWEFNP